MKRRPSNSALKSEYFIVAGLYEVEVPFIDSLLRSSLFICKVRMDSFRLDTIGHFNRHVPAFTDVHNSLDDYRLTEFGISFRVPLCRLMHVEHVKPDMTIMALH